MRRIFYLTGTRADFGLMRSTLERIHAHSGMELGLIVTAMHLSDHYGETVREIEVSNLPIVARVPVALRSDNSADMARAIGHELLGIVDVLERLRPDMLLLLGDRGEMLAGAIAALHCNIPIVHLHGGECSGTVDEPVRHAISKLAHYHLTATEGAKQRLIRMGELPENIHVTGAPGLDGLVGSVRSSRGYLAQRTGFDSLLPIALVVFHPVVQQAHEAATQAKQLLEALSAIPDLQSLLLMPNADAGGESIRQVFQDAESCRCRTAVHLPRLEFIEWMAAVDVMVGNSSSGIIEAASFGTPVVNIGNRQSGRERNANVLDVPPNGGAIEQAIRRALAGGRSPAGNIYGSGDAAERIVSLLEAISLGPDLLMKQNAY